MTRRIIASEYSMFHEKKLHLFRSVISPTSQEKFTVEVQQVHVLQSLLGNINKSKITRKELSTAGWSNSNKIYSSKRNALKTANEMQRRSSYVLN